jgi:DNA-binding FrmR family transcriptional regulator
MAEICEDIKKQMNRIKGQLTGVEKMIEEGRDPLDIIQQISAVRAALSRLAVEILKDESKSCFKKDKTEEKLQKFEELVTNLFKLT